jgi:hypothetical protein
MKMDFERGLRAMKQMAEGTEWQQDFLLYEARLRANLRDEHRFGPTEQTRNERARIVDQLNALAIANLPMSFNELCLGAQPPTPTIAQAHPTTAQPPKDTFEYDAFISFSMKDQNWVHNTLLPHLTRANVRTCLPDRDFALGRPRLVNIEDALKRSRRTLLIMTPDWLKDEFSAFETLLIQTSDPIGTRQRMLPIKVRPCELPERLAAIDALDLIDPSDFTTQMQRLIRTIFTTF